MIGVMAVEHLLMRVKRWPGAGELGVEVDVGEVVVEGDVDELEEGDIEDSPPGGLHLPRSDRLLLMRDLPKVRGWWREFAKVGDALVTVEIEDARRI